MTAHRRRFLDITLFVAAFLSIGLQFHNARFGAGFETFAIARNLVGQGQYANPFDSVTGPTAHLPPLYPFFLALLMRLCRSVAGFATLLSICHMMAHGLYAALLPRISDLFFHDRRPGIWAAIMMILLPVMYFFPHSEGIFCAVGLMLFCLVTDRRLSRGGAAGALFTGMFAGLLVLLNPACVVVCGLWLLYLAWRRRIAYAGPSVTCIAVAFLVTLAPWTWRNYRTFHAVFFVRDNLGMELYDSNNDLAQSDVVRNMPTALRRFHPGSSPAEAAAVRDMGELQYNHRRMAEALAWIRSHPRSFLSLTLDRMGLFWFPDAEGFTPLHGYSVTFVTVSAFLGIALMARRHVPIAVFLAAVAALYPIAYYFVAIDGRYRTPMLWISLLGAGYFLAAAAAACRRPVTVLHPSIPPLHLLK